MNPVIQLQKQHRSIRKFKAEAVDQAIIDELVEVALSGATSSYMQACSIISITDEALKMEIAKISGQYYVDHSGHLFVFVADLARNAEIAKQQGGNPICQSSGDRFLAGVYDATIAAQNLVLAAESIGLGTVYLGSILNDSQRMIELLNLPKLTFPVFALAIGYPDQEPDQKPRLPKSITYMQNRYVSVTEQPEELAAYDQQLTEYYQARGENTRVDTFSHMATQYTQTQLATRTNLGKVLKAQGFLTELDK
ncbi:NADPH-dependent oxidoreductase [Actinobacillus vicugnae]|uniref:NADPH-dependent oxidoreductase n=1 Tax=Actinobacillus vicugnae TaxID=2573093 RepID=UPI001241FCE8|nr:NADPH-dependent oxidoreductase [Actinobacillus vicugnae]